MYLPHWPIPSNLGNRSINYETVFLRMAEVLFKLKNPEKKLPPVIHVTGTNGKGSVIAFLASILKACGLSVHIYTSPHLHDCNERIVLAGEKISNNFLFEIMEEARIAADQTPLTFFEGFTIGAFLAFSKVPADVILIESGMGARIDATNIIEKKLATIITPISFDHTEYLGNSIAQIAFEKSHIIRPDTPVIIGPQPKQAQEMIEVISRDQNAKTIRYDQEFSIDLLLFEQDQDQNRNTNPNFDLNYFDNKLCNLPAPALLGQHQYINASIAIASALSLPFKITQQDIELGLTTAKWPNRLEKINNNLNKLLTNSDSEIFIDGAHNQAGAFALARFIAEKKSEELANFSKLNSQNLTINKLQKPNIVKKNFIICGFTKNKCKEEFLKNFINVVDGAAAITVDGEPNPEDAEIICKIAAGINFFMKPCCDLLDAIYYLNELASNSPCRIIICGSLHLARDVKKFGQYISA